MRLTKKKKPLWSAAVLLSIIAACCISGVFANGGVTRMNFDAMSLPPGAVHLFGTDRLGRDLFKMVLYGGRVSLFIGISAAAISAVIALLYGAASGLAGKHTDNLLMRLTELLMSVPSILYVVSLQAILGKPTVLSITLVIGVTSWMSIAKIVRAEVRQARNSEYMLSAKLMGAGFFYSLVRHLLPNVMPSVMYMLITNVSHAIAAEATLSFLGLGLPPDTASWGTLIELAQNALLSNSWWVVVFPMLFLVATLVCITNIGEYLRSINS